MKGALDWILGFFEVSAQQSMTRLLALLCVLLAAAVVGIIGWLVVRKDPSAGVIAALSGVLTALIGGGAVALISRSKPDPVADATQPTEKPNAP